MDPLYTEQLRKINDKFQHPTDLEARWTYCSKRTQLLQLKQHQLYQFAKHTSANEVCTTAKSKDRVVNMADRFGYHVHAEAEARHGDDDFNSTYQDRRTTLLKLQLHNRTLELTHERDQIHAAEALLKAFVAQEREAEECFSPYTFLPSPRSVHLMSHHVIIPSGIVQCQWGHTFPYALAYVSRNEDLVIIDSKSTNVRHEWSTGHTQPITDIQWSPKDELIGTTSEDGSLQIWETQSGRYIQTFVTANERPFVSMRWLSVTICLAVTMDGWLKVLRINKHEPGKGTLLQNVRVERHGSMIQSLATSMKFVYVSTTSKVVKYHIQISWQDEDLFCSTSDSNTRADPEVQLLDKGIVYNRGSLTSPLSLFQAHRTEAISTIASIQILSLRSPANRTVVLNILVTFTSDHQVLGFILNPKTGTFGRISDFCAQESTLVHLTCCSSLFDEVIAMGTSTGAILLYECSIPQNHNEILEDDVHEKIRFELYREFEGHHHFRRSPMATLLSCANGQYLTSQDEQGVMVIWATVETESNTPVGRDQKKTYHYRNCGYCGILVPTVRFLRHLERHIRSFRDA